MNKNNVVNLMSQKDIEQYLNNPLLDEEKKIYINKIIDNGSKLYFDKNLNTIYSSDKYLIELELKKSKSSECLFYLSILSLFFIFVIFASEISTDIPVLFKYLISFAIVLIYLGSTFFFISDMKTHTKEISSVTNENKIYLDLVSMSNTIINNGRGTNV